MYILVNNNYIIPEIYNFENEFLAFHTLQKITHCRYYDYCKNIYLLLQINNICTNLYYVNADNIFNKNLLKNENDSIYYTNIYSYFNNNKYLIPYNKENNYLDFKNDLKELNIIIGDEINNNCNIVISNNDTILNNEESNNLELNKTDNENIKEEENLAKMCEEVLDLYQKELSNIKKLELNLKSYDSRLLKLKKRKIEYILNNINRTKSEYQTWKKLKYKINNDLDMLKYMNELEINNDIDSIPILFLSKFNYINKLILNENIKIIFEIINNIDLNELYNENKIPDDNIILFCNKYIKLSNELNYNFEHEWDYLENEMNSNSTNSLNF